MNARWIAVSTDRWELRGLDGRKLGALVKMPSSWSEMSQFRGDRWAPLPRGKNYLATMPRIRAAAWDLEFHLGVRSSDASPENRRRAALLP